MTVAASPNPGHLLRIDPETGRVLARLEHFVATQIAGDDFLWAIAMTAEEKYTLVRVDTDTNEITALTELPPSLEAVDASLRWPTPWADLMEATRGATVGEGSVWLPGFENDTTVRLDPMTGEVQGRIRGAGWPLAVGGGAVWVQGGWLRVDWADHEFQKPVDVAQGTVSRYDLTTGDLRTTVVGGMPGDLAVAGDSVWVAVRVR